MKKVENIAHTDSTSATQRGKYAHMLASGSNVAVVNADLVEHSPDSEPVNHAFRAFLAFGREFEAYAPAGRKRAKLANGERSGFDPRSGISKAKVSLAK